MTQDRDVFRLDGRSALVTGAGGGVGEAIARAFSAAGAAVLVTDIDKDAAVATAESITAAGGTAQPFVHRQEGGPVARQVVEEMLACAGAQIEHVRPDMGGTGVACPIGTGVTTYCATAAAGCTGATWSIA